MYGIVALLLTDWLLFISKVNLNGYRAEKEAILTVHKIQILFINIINSTIRSKSFIFSEIKYNVKT